MEDPSEGDPVLPSTLKPDDLAVVIGSGKNAKCILVKVAFTTETAAFARPMARADIPLCRKIECFSDEEFLVLEVNGESLF